MESLTIRRPDDWHLHLRDGAMLKAVLPETARHFARAIVMPNLVPPVVTAADAADYRDRIMWAKPRNNGFKPLMTLYLTEETEPRDVRAAAEIGLIAAVKLYPAGATTNSASGVRDMGRVMRVLETMAQVRLPLLVHGEVTDPEIDIFDREAVFIDRVLAPLRERLPELRVVMEHITTAEAADYVRGGTTIGATITPQHLLLDRNDLLAGGLRPHNYCLPILKARAHRDALRALVAEGAPNVFLGTDSAPHPRHAKEAECCAAGCFSAPVALAAYATAFEEVGALAHLEAFASLNGPDFYGLPPNEGTITLVREETPPPRPLRYEDGEVRVWHPGRPLPWRVSDERTDA